MSIPKEPRQLMINIMYLVLTALLALNVSAEIFNAFEMVDDGLKTANKSLDESNSSLPALIKDASKKRDSYKVYADRVDGVRNLSKSSSSYISAIVDQLIDESGDRNGTHDEGDYLMVKDKRELKGKKAYDATTRLMVDEGKGEELKSKIMDIKNEFLQFVDEADRPKIAANLPLSIDEEAWKNSPNAKKNWSDFTFGHMPLGATMPIFTKYTNDIKASEAAVLNYLAGKVGAGSNDNIVLDKFTVVSAPKKSYIIKGEKFETDVFLSASAGKDSQTGLSISVNGKGLRADADGVAKYTATASQLGVKKYNAAITVTDPVTGEKKTYKKEFEYEVGERSVTVSPLKMNVFYIGVDNPVAVSAAGVASGDVKVTMSGPGGGTINRKDGNWNVRVKTPTKKDQFAKINVSAPGLNESRDFRVKRIPSPTPTLSMKKGGAMPSGEFKVQQGVLPVLEGFDFDAKCTITDFVVVRVPKRQDPEPARNSGGKFTGKAKSIVGKATAGDKYFFENIKCKCPGDAAARNIGQMVFNIK